MKGRTLAPVAADARLPKPKDSMIGSRRKGRETGSKHTPQGRRLVCVPRMTPILPLFDSESRNLCKIARTFHSEYIQFPAQWVRRSKGAGSP